MALILNGSEGLSDVDGSASTPAIRGTDTNTGIFFPAADTIAFAEGGAEVARFDSSGNLGIGTAPSGAKLDISGSGGVNLKVTSTNSNAQLILNSSGTNGSYINYGQTGANFLAFYDSNAAAERMRIDSSGNLLVGTTSRQNATTFAVLSGGNISEFRTSVGSCDAVAFYTSGSTLAGRININGSSASYITSSDYRLKENIAPMTDALSKVALLKPCTYTWKESGEASQGFIAHELQAVCPDAVVGEKDAVNEDGSINPQGVDTSFLVATLTAAIQEQQAIITDLKARLEVLEAK